MQSAAVCTLASHNSAMCRFKALASLLIPIDPLLIPPIAGGFPVHVAIDPFPVQQSQLEVGLD